MSKLKIELVGKGSIDNAVIYLEDPKERMPHQLLAKTRKKWTLDNLHVPVDGLLDYSLYVLAYSGTEFTCTITEKDTNKTISFDGMTGKKIKNIAHENGSEQFS